MFTGEVWQGDIQCHSREEDKLTDLSVKWTWKEHIPNQYFSEEQTNKQALQSHDEMKWTAGVLGHFFCTMKVESGRVQPGLMRWNFYETCPRAVSIPSTLDWVQRTTVKPRRPPKVTKNIRHCSSMCSLAHKNTIHYLNVSFGSSFLF